jgi:hypothetical protein
MVRGDVADNAKGLRPGDWVEAHGTIDPDSWKVNDGKKLARPILEATSIELRWHKTHRNS